LKPKKQILLWVLITLLLLSTLVPAVVLAIRGTPEYLPFSALPAILAIRLHWLWAIPTSM